MKLVTHQIAGCDEATTWMDYNVVRFHPLRLQPCGQRFNRRRPAHWLMALACLWTTGKIKKGLTNDKD